MTHSRQYQIRFTKAHGIAGFTFAFSLAAVLAQTPFAWAAAPVLLGKAGDFAILSKSGISSVPPSAITGALGVSPIDSTAITGFSLIMDASGQFATSSQVSGKIFAPDYGSPTPVNLTIAVGDMETAYTDAAGRTLPDHTELGGGNIGGLTLPPGLYKWGTGVSIPANVTLSGGPEDVWIFQIAGNLSIASNKAVILNGGAETKNIFWQVAGGVGVVLGTGSHFEGVILAQAGIDLLTGASINGRLLAQTAVTLDSNTVTPQDSPTVVLRSSSNVLGPYTYAANQALNLAGKTITVPMSGSMRFYRIWSTTAVTIRAITVVSGNVVIGYE